MALTTPGVAGKTRMVHGVQFTPIDLASSRHEDPFQGLNFDPTTVGKALLDSYREHLRARSQSFPALRDAVLVHYQANLRPPSEISGLRCDGDIKFLSKELNIPEDLARLIF